MFYPKNTAIVCIIVFSFILLLPGILAGGPSGGEANGIERPPATTNVFFPVSPYITTWEVTDITHESASGGGTVTPPEGFVVQERGVCWSKQPGAHIDHYKSLNGSGPGDYSSKLVGLDANTVYYYRAYATFNNDTWIFGEEYSFKTADYPPLQWPEVITQPVTDVTYSSAVCGGNVITQGSGWVKVRGICWSTDPKPTILGNKTTDGTGMGIYISSMTGLTPGTVYYVRAYAQTAVGIDYGDEVSFSTEPLKIPTVSTFPVSGVGMSTAVCGGRISADGGGKVTARGICWGTSERPGISGPHSFDGTGTGEFSRTVTGLEPGTRYYVRAYAVNEIGTAYGESQSFATDPAPVDLPGVSTNQASQITATTAVCGGEINSDGGDEISARGVCWSKNPYPDISGNHTDDGTGSGSFRSTITDLEPAATYYVRAYAANSAGTAYGEHKEFTTESLPTVSVTITYPDNGDTVRGIVNIKTRVNKIGSPAPRIERVEFYIKDELVKTDTRKPYKCRWDTRTYSDGDYTVEAKTFGIDGLLNTDKVSVTVANDNGGSPQIVIQRNQLHFGAVIGADGEVYQSYPQGFTVANSGDSVLHWTASASDSWLTVTPTSGMEDETVTVSVDARNMAVGSYTGTIFVESSKAANNTQAVTVSLKVKDHNHDYEAIGTLEVPGDGETVGGSVPISGWALDDVGIESVKIYRDPVPPEIGVGKIYIGTATFVAGARPDVEAGYSTYPYSYRAGWGYMLLADMLPFSRDGYFVLRAVATEVGGRETELQATAIYVLNENTKPFGAIETPESGGVASGSDYVNWGWALTPPPATIPFDGSTLTLWVDGVPLPEVAVYNLYRKDLAEYYPDHNNSQGAVGYFYLDTTEYDNGIHVISWSAKDDAGNVGGIGSRHFFIDNGAAGKAGAAAAENQSLSRNNRNVNRSGFASSPYLGITESKLQSMSTSAGERTMEIRIKPGEPVSLPTVFDGSPGDVTVYMIVNGKLMGLPVGSTFDREKGILYWQPGPAFKGEYRLVMICSDTGMELKSQQIKIIIGKSERKKN